MFHGTDSGVYVCELGNASRSPINVVPLAGVTQVNGLEEHHLLLVLANHFLYTFNYNPSDPFDPLRYGECGIRYRRVSYFSSGVCLGRTLVCGVNSSSSGSSVVKVLEPVDQNVHPTRRGLREFKCFYIPCNSSSVRFLKTKLCISSDKAFELVDLHTLQTCEILDPEDSNLDLVRGVETLKPITIYRIQNEFLLCYDQFALCVDRDGRRSRGDYLIHWMGQPSSFALHYPYLLAFDPSLVEVRNIETGALHQTIFGSGLRCLFSDTPPPLPREVYDRETPRSLPWLRNLREPSTDASRSQIILQGDEGTIFRLQLAEPDL